MPILWPVVILVVLLVPSTPTARYRVAAITAPSCRDRRFRGVPPHNVVDDRYGAHPETSGATRESVSARELERRLVSERTSP